MAGRFTMTIYEEVMLLALKDRKGTTSAGAYYQQALAGAILAELLLAGRIKVEQVKKKRFARVVNSRQLGDQLLDECLERIASSKKRQQLQTWVSRFANLKQLKQRVALQLCREGVLKEAEDRVLLIFRRKVYPEVNPGPERDIIERLRRAIYTETSDVDPRTVVLVALAHHAKLLPMAFEKKKLKQRKKRIEAVVNGDVISAATKSAIEATQAAAAMVAIMPAVFAATAASTAR